MANNNKSGFNGINFCGMRFATLGGFLLYLLLGPVFILLGILLCAKNHPGGGAFLLGYGLFITIGFGKFLYSSQSDMKKASEKLAEEARFRQQSEKIDTVGAKMLFEIWDADTQKVVCKKTKDGKLFYLDVVGNNSYYGKPEFRIIETGVTEYKYHPSQYYYVGATVGGVTTGGIYKTRDSYSSKNIEAESGFICCEYKGPQGKQKASAIKFVLNNELAKKAAETDVVKDYLQSKNILKVQNRDPSVSRDLYDLMNFSVRSGANASTTLTIKSKAEAAMFAPLSDCRYCLDFINTSLSEITADCSPAKTSTPNSSGQKADNSDSEVGSYEVIMTKCGTPKGLVNYDIRTLTGITFGEAEELLEHSPAFIAKGVSQRKAELIKTTLEARGCKIEIKKN